MAGDNDKSLSSKEMVQRAREALGSPPDLKSPPAATEAGPHVSRAGVAPDAVMSADVSEAWLPDRPVPSSEILATASKVPPRSRERARPQPSPPQSDPTGESGRTWRRIAAVASVLIVVGTVVAPRLADILLDSADTNWVTDRSELPEGVSAAVLDDYSLRADFEGTVLVAPGATLDCSDHTIAGVRIGVLLSEESSLVGCIVEGPGVGVGVTGRGVTIRDLTVTGVDIGVIVEPDSTLDCSDSTISGSDPVVGVYAQDGATITSCRVSGFNTAIGLGGSRDVVVEGVHASGNRIGYYLVNGSTGVHISDSVAEGNEIGFLFEQSVSDVTIARNHALQNWGAAFQIGDTTNSLFAENTVEGGGSGFWLTQSHDNRFERNTVSDASQWFSIGLERFSSRNVFAANEVSGGGVGIAVFGGASDNQFVDNTLHHNTKGAHTEAVAGQGNTFIGNLVNDNSHVGLWDDTAGAPSRYKGNKCSSNADANSVPDGLC
jgi:nitrous oxidase accessory protein NosD